MKEIDRPDTNKPRDPSLALDNPHTPTDPSPLAYPDLSELPYERELADYFHDLVMNKAPADVSLGLRAMISLHLRSNHAIVMHANYEAYQMLRLAETSRDQQIHEIVGRAKKSTASPAELLLLNLSTDIPSTELKKLTHPFGRRREYVEPMEAEVENAIEGLGGHVYDPGETVADIDIIPHRYSTEGFIVVVRQLVGEVEALRIKKRKTYVINTASSDFDPDVRKKIDYISKELSQDEWGRRIIEETGLREYVDDALAANGDVPYLYELSTLLYSYHPDRKKFHTEKEKRKTQSRHAHHLAQKALSDDFRK
ncbi:MAG: hypothetical protein JWO61_219 [Candidatus Saccharibacteria bacterium]|nr:hypothetical protein [Candidatus Saccharibacteria bacterium]